MHFKPMLLLLGLAASVTAQISAPELTANLDDLALKSSKAKVYANDISPVNFYTTTPVCYSVPPMHLQGPFGLRPFVLTGISGIVRQVEGHK